MRTICLMISLMVDHIKTMVSISKNEDMSKETDIQMKKIFLINIVIIQGETIEKGIKEIINQTEEMIGKKIIIKIRLGSIKITGLRKKYRRDF